MDDINPVVAERDRLARTDMLAKLEHKIKNIGPKGLVENRSYRRNLKIVSDTVSIDRDVLKKEAKFDGKHLILTNSSLPMDQVLHTKNSVKEAYSAFKALKMRPPLHMQSLDT